VDNVDKLMWIKHTFRIGDFFKGKLGKWENEAKNADK
jgi:hypothetical protein